MDVLFPAEWIDALRLDLATKQANCPAHEFVDIGATPFCRLCGYFPPAKPKESP